MKILKYFFYALLIVLALFLSTGLLVSSQDYSVEVVVARSPKECWKTFTDSTRLDKWILNFHSIKILEKSGSVVEDKYMLTVMQDGTKYLLTELITGYEEESYFAMQIENDLLVNDVKYTFEPQAGGTIIVSTNHLKGKDIFSKSIFVFMKGMFVSQAKADLYNLKTLIEEP